MSKELSETEWWHDLIEGIYGKRKGGARIIIDSENASTGVGKTGLAVYLARALSDFFGYELQKEDFTLSGEHYLQRWRDHPGADQPSVVVLDELGGAGAGHARRAMSTQNVELGNAWQLMRKKRIVSLVTLPHWSKVDKDMRQQADYRLWCKEKPIGYFRPYIVGSGFDAGDVTTEGYNDINRIHFPNLDKHEDPFYEYLNAEKDELLDSGLFDADELQEGEETDEDSIDTNHYHRDDVIKMLYESTDKSQQDVADVFDISRQRVGQIIREDTDASKQPA